MAMIPPLFVIAAAGLCAVAASYVMWRATARSGLWSLIAGIVLGIAAFASAVLIAWLMTRAAFGP